jgi:HTH-type transcriptional regulator/antitoxin HipB
LSASWEGEALEDYLLPLPNRVEEFRKAQNMTQEELGKIVGVRKATISKIENGRNVTMRTAQKIAKALGSDTKELWPT